MDGFYKGEVFQIQDTILVLPSPRCSPVRIALFLTLKLLFR